MTEADFESRVEPLLVQGEFACFTQPESAGITTEIPSVVDLHQAFVESRYYELAESVVRGEHNKPEDVTPEEWVGLLGPDMLLATHGLYQYEAVVKPFLLQSVNSLDANGRFTLEEMSDIAVATIIHDFHETEDGDTSDERKVAGSETTDAEKSRRIAHETIDSSPDLQPHSEQLHPAVDRAVDNVLLGLKTTKPGQAFRITEKHAYLISGNTAWLQHRKRSVRPEHAELTAGLKKFGVSTVFNHVPDLLAVVDTHPATDAFLARRAPLIETIFRREFEDILVFYHPHEHEGVRQKHAKAHSLWKQSRYAWTF